MLLRRVRIYGCEICVFMEVLDHFCHLLRFRFGGGTWFTPFNIKGSGRRGGDSHEHFTLQRCYFSMVVFFLPGCRSVLYVQDLGHSTFHLLLRPYWLRQLFSWQTRSYQRQRHDLPNGPYPRTSGHYVYLPLRTRTFYNDQTVLLPLPWRPPFQNRIRRLRPRLLLRHLHLLRDPYHLHLVR